MTTWTNRIVETGAINPAELAANPQNARRHPPGQRDAVRESLGRIGWVAPVIVNRTTGFVVDGHARIEEAVTRNEPTIPVAYVELTEDEERFVLATLDPIAAMADTDAAMLTELLDGITIDTDPLRELLDNLTGTTPPPTGHTDPDDAPPPPQQPHTQPGDHWLLGPHHLVCGDSTQPDPYAATLQQHTADLVWTDPPYGVAYTGKTRDQLTIANDNLTIPALETFLREAFTHTHTHTPPRAHAGSSPAPQAHHSPRSPSSSTNSASGVKPSPGSKTGSH